MVKGMAPCLCTKQNKGIVEHSCDFTFLLFVSRRRVKWGESPPSTLHFHFLPQQPPALPPTVVP